jgi:hypothetical protein
MTNAVGQPSESFKSRCLRGAHKRLGQFCLLLGTDQRRRSRVSVLPIAMPSNSVVAAGDLAHPLGTAASGLCHLAGELTLREQPRDLIGTLNGMAGLAAAILQLLCRQVLDQPRRLDSTAQWIATWSSVRETT